MYAEGGMQKITLGITVLQERLARDYEIENPVGNPLPIEKLKEPELNKQFPILKTYRGQVRFHTLPLH